MTLDFNSTVFSAYINLEHRIDRRKHMQKELTRTGLKATRAIGIKPDKETISHPKFSIMAQRNTGGGSIGCHLSQVAVILNAHQTGNHAMVLEDDLIFCNDLQYRFKLIEDFCNNNEWDIIFLGCCFHPNSQSKYQWHRSENGKHTHPDMQGCNCALNRDVEKTEYPHILRAYGVWSTHAYIVNYNSIPRILQLLEDNVHLSMGIDWLFMYLAPQMKQFAFVPGCVKQYDNQSDIGTGITKFSAFKALGDHWFCPTMKGFDYNKFYRNL